MGPWELEIQRFIHWSFCGVQMIVGGFFLDFIGAVPLLFGTIGPERLW